MKTCQKCKEYYSDDRNVCQSCGGELIPCDSEAALCGGGDKSVWTSILLAIVALFIGATGVSYIFSGALFAGVGLIIVACGTISFKKWALYTLYIIIGLYFLFHIIVSVSGATEMAFFIPFDVLIFMFFYKNREEFK